LTAASVTSLKMKETMDIIGRVDFIDEDVAGIRLPQDNIGAPGR
jgi:hypothetical protein